MELSSKKNEGKKEKETGQKVSLRHRFGHLGGQNVAVRFEHFLRFLLLRRRQRPHIRLELGFDLLRRCVLPTLAIAYSRCRDTARRCRAAESCLPAFPLREIQTAIRTFSVRKEQSAARSSLPSALTVFSMS